MHRHLILQALLALSLCLTGCGISNITLNKGSSATSSSSSTRQAASSASSDTVTMTNMNKNIYPISFSKDTASWRRAYLNALISNEILNGEYPDQYLFSFIYVDNDTIPELVAETDNEAGGCQIFTYHKGSVDMLQTDRLNFDYIPEGNLLNNNDGHMGVFYDYVYSILNGKWHRVFEGDYGESDDGKIDYDPATDTYIGADYRISGKSVSEKEYHHALRTLFNSDKATKPVHYYMADDLVALLKTGHLASYGHQYALVTGDCSWTNAYELAQASGGYLVSITSDEEFDTITRQIRKENKSAYSFWIGMTRNPAYTHSESGYQWTDPSLTQKDGTRNLNHWYQGMPSYSEKLSDGTEAQDYYAELIYRKSDDAFYFNDTFDNPISEFPSFAGYMGYIIEFNNAADKEAYLAKNRTSLNSQKNTGNYCRDLAKAFGTFSVAMSSGYPTEGSNYYSVPVEVRSSDDYAVIGPTIGKTTVRIRKDAKVLYLDENGTSLITLNAYAKKLSAPDFKRCKDIRIWYDDTPDGTGAYQIYYDKNGYITQFYDGEFE